MTGRGQRAGHFKKFKKTVDLPPHSAHIDDITSRYYISLKKHI